MKRAATAGAAALILVLGLAPVAADAQISLGVNRLNIVSAAGSATQNCQNLRDALTAIADATSMNPYTLRLEPGEYDCEANTVTMKSYVDLEGSGEGVTRVFGNAAVDGLGVIDLAAQMEIRFVTVESSGQTAVSATTGEARITNATLVSEDATGTSSYGLLAKSTAVVRIADSRIKGADRGILMQDTSMVTVHRSTVEGPANQGINLAAGAGALLASSQLINGFTNAGTALTCLYSYAGNLAELDSGCNPPPP